MTYEVLPAPLKPIPVTRRPRAGGVATIVQGHIHATRGPTIMADQVEATVNWFANNRPFSQGNNHGSWGSSADFVVGPYDGGIAIFEFGDWLHTYSSWSAGFGVYGARLEHGASEHAVAIEVSQPPRMVGGEYQPGDSDVPFTPETLDALTWLAGYINDELVRAGGTVIPPVRIPYWDQLIGQPIPRGWIGHEDLANGHKGGKSDPGQMFDWDAFLASLEAEMMSPPAKNLPLAIHVWQSGATPLPMDGEIKRYEIRI